MILDLQTKFSGSTTAAGVTTGQNVTVTAISTNVLDLRQSNIPLLADEGISGPEMWFCIDVDTAITAAGAATVTFSLESDSTADLATSATVHWTTAAIGKATLIAGFNVVRIQLPSAATYERFLGVRYTVATGPLTQSPGGFVAYLTPSIPRIINYAAGFTIDV